MDPIPKLSNQIWSLPAFSVRDFPGNVFIKVSKMARMLLAQHPGGFTYFYKDISKEVPDGKQR